MNGGTISGARLVGCIVLYMEPPISPSTIMDSKTVGRAPKAPAPCLWRRPKAASILVGGEIGGSIDGTVYPTISCFTNSAVINNPSGRTIDYSGRIIAQTRVCGPLH